MTGQPLHVYAICYLEFDSRTQLHGCLSNIRRNYFENGTVEKQVITDCTDGVRTKYSYYISHWGMGWKKMVDDHLLEYSVPDRDGCAILYQDSQSHHYAKSVYDANLDWKKTYYYRNGEQPVCSIELIDDRGVILMEEYNPDGSIKTSTNLYPGYSDVNTDMHDKLDQISGKPMIYAATNRGEVCFCTAEQARLRGDAMEELQPEIVSMDLEDIMVSTFDWDERGSKLFAECVMLLRGEDPDQKPEEVEQLVKNVSKDTDDIGAELQQTIKETEDWLRKLSADKKEEEEPVELYSYSSSDAQEQDQDVAEIMAIIRGIEERNHEEQRAAREESYGKSLMEELKQMQTGGKKPTRYTVAGKKINSRMVHAADIFDKKHGRAV